MWLGHYMLAFLSYFECDQIQNQIQGGRDVDIDWILPSAFSTEFPILCLSYQPEGFVLSSRSINSLTCLEFWKFLHFLFSSNMLPDLREILFLHCSLHLLDYMFSDYIHCEIFFPPIEGPMICLAFSSIHTLLLGVYSPPHFQSLWLRNVSDCTPPLFSVAVV